jgi:hypothetical protein
MPVERPHHQASTKTALLSVANNQAEAPLSIGRLEPHHRSDVEFSIARRQIEPHATLAERYTVAASKRPQNVASPGLADKIQYITHYPGHSTQSAQPVIGDALTILAGSLRKNYLSDLIVRHATAQKSQTARMQGKMIDPLEQLNTILLSPQPKKNTKGGVYVRSPLKEGKTILVVDDFCTEGNSFEAARAYIENTGAKAICLGWLKTINRDYHEFTPRPKLMPYEVNKLTSVPTRVTHSFGRHIRYPEATADLGKVFAHYYGWKWPTL